jgi:hypothetical protein
VCSSHDPNLLTGKMSTKIIFTRNSPSQTVLVNETTGQELYRIDTPLRFIGSVTRVFRCGSAAISTPNPEPRDANELHKGSNSLAGSERGGGNEGSGGVAGTVDGAPGEDSPLVENEIARLYWNLLAPTRIVFEGKVRTRAELMPLKGGLKG